MVLDQLNTKQSTRIKLRERVTRAPAPISRVSGWSSTTRIVRPAPSWR